MDVNRIVSEIDAEIAHLQQIRSALAGYSGGSITADKPKRGRPKGSKNVAATAATPAKRTRKVSADGRKRIAEAMKRHWAERRKEAAKKA